MMIRHRLRMAAAGMVLAILASGCGGADPKSHARVAVSGTVTLDGQPLDNAVILFVPLPEVNGPTASAGIVEGRFQLSAEAGPVAGKHRVQIESNDHGGIAPDDEAALAEMAAGKRKLPKTVKIPAIYNSRSKLEETIAADSPNEFTFELVTRK
ncbi:hypothetical protein Pan44_16690 [Caulifigura coniformis]|uniref:Carboxypeptidase regulatory-like domain-containing protein n=1 Tax=Caulifigura coniformis TaxID=2527983 RepID=A0A517SC20_9PLAN|nr:hypothetical protein [Caulifigura coniformis]QDT53646.1 hypothetical protein Pan44_16690 [Caulifigura coniformis]